jgi:folate-dependent phosphoribosylglycinamide formyltransferase PurN
MRWAAMFSQTGSEICNLSEKIGRYPDLVISDNTNMSSRVDPRLELNCSNIRWSKYRGLSTEQKLAYYRDYLDRFDVITLHGWLNIIPPEICNEFKIFNGHPGLINYYPELKGKDPQVRTWENIASYIFIGSVVHRVTPIVDDGDISSERMVIANRELSLADTFDALRQTSLDSWIDFFGKEHYNNL